MPAISVTVQTVHPRKLAAVRRDVAPGGVGAAWGPAVSKVWDFLRVRKKWWLGPIILVLVLFGGLLVLAQGSAVAPFIYTIF